MNKSRKELLMFLWQVYQEAMGEDVPLESIEFKIASELSPYFEVNAESIITHDLFSAPKNLVEVNVFYRFEQIFDTIIQAKKVNPILLQKLVNMIIHYLASLDFIANQDIVDIQLQLLEKDIHNGNFGSFVKDHLHYFLEKERKVLIKYCRCLYIIGGTLETFVSVVQELYPNSYFYKDRRKPNHYLLYLPVAESSTNEVKINVLKEMFAPLELDITICWNDHFGIIGENQLMILDEILIVD
jgi:hypothetical protein